jgi:hypothetical protein
MLVGGFLLLATAAYFAIRSLDAHNAASEPSSASSAPQTPHSGADAAAKTPTRSPLPARCALLRPRRATQFARDVAPEAWTRARDAALTLRPAPAPPARSPTSTSAHARPAPSSLARAPALPSPVNTARPKAAAPAPAPAAAQSAQPDTPPLFDLEAASPFLVLAPSSPRAEPTASPALAATNPTTTSAKRAALPAADARLAQTALWTEMMHVYTGRLRFDAAWIARGLRAGACLDSMLAALGGTDAAANLRLPGGRLQLGLQQPALGVWAPVPLPARGAGRRALARAPAPLAAPAPDALLLRDADLCALFDAARARGVAFERLARPGAVPAARLPALSGAAVERRDVVYYASRVRLAAALAALVAEAEAAAPPAAAPPAPEVVVAAERWAGFAGAAGGAPVRARAPPPPDLRRGAGEAAAFEAYSSLVERGMAAAATKKAAEAPAPGAAPAQEDSESSAQVEYCLGYLPFAFTPPTPLAAAARAALARGFWRFDCAPGGLAGAAARLAPLAARVQAALCAGAAAEVAAPFCFCAGEDGLWVLNASTLEAALLADVGAWGAAGRALRLGRRAGAGAGAGTGASGPCRVAAYL